MKFVFRGSEENYEFMVDDKPTISKSSRKFEAETVDEIVENFYMFLRGMGFYVEIPERSNSFQDFVDEFLPQKEDEVDDYLADVEEVEGGGWMISEDIEADLMRFSSMSPCERARILEACVEEGICEEPSVESLIDCLQEVKNSISETQSDILLEKTKVSKALEELRKSWVELHDNSPTQCCGGNCHVETTSEAKEDPQ